MDSRGALARVWIFGGRLFGSRPFFLGASFLVLPVAQALSVRDVIAEFGGTGGRDDIYSGVALVSHSTDLAHRLWTIELVSLAQFGRSSIDSLGKHRFIPASGSIRHGAADGFEVAQNRHRSVKEWLRMMVSLANHEACVNSTRYP